MDSIGSNIIKLLRWGDIYVSFRYRLRFLVSACGILLIALSYLFFSTLLKIPTRTPILILSSTYAPPWDINPWGEANSRAISALAGHTLTVKSIDDAGILAQGQWSELEDKLAQLDHSAAIGKPLLIYINLHGLVDSDQRPYLLVRNSKPLDSSTWLPLQSLIDHVSHGVKSSRPIVLFLESGRQLATLPSERNENQFAIAVRKLLDTYAQNKSGRSLSILVDSTDRIGAQDPNDGLPDPFTRFLARALSGECDQRSVGGDGDKTVDFEELCRFTIEKTNDFSIQQRGFAQRVFVAQTEPLVTPIAWAGVPRKMTSASEVGAATSDQVRRIESVWRAIETLKKKTPWREHPAQWSRLNQLAVAIEDSAFSGPDNRKRFTDFANEFERIQRDLEAKQVEHKVGLDIQMAQRASLVWGLFAKSPSLPNALHLMEEQKLFLDGYEWNTTPFLSHLCTRSNPAIWKQVELLQEYAISASNLESARSLLSQVVASKAIVEEEISLDILRRSIEDRLWVGGFESQLTRDVANFKEGSESFLHTAENLSRAQSSHEYALSMLPSLSRAVDAIDTAPVTTADRSLSIRFEQMVEKLGLNLAIQRGNFHSNIAQPVFDVSDDLIQIQREIALGWQKLLQSTESPSPLRHFAIHQLLKSGVLPAESEFFEKGIQRRLTSRKTLSVTGNTTDVSALSSDDPTPLVSRCDHIVARLISQSARNDANTAVDGRSGSSSQPVKRFVELAHKSMGGRSLLESLEIGVSATGFARIVSAYCVDPECCQLIEQVYSSQQKYRLLRGADRIGEDFWNTPKIDSLPYFYSVASRFLDTIPGDEESGFIQELNRSRQTIAMRMEAAKNAISLSADDLPRWKKSVAAQTRFEIEPTTAAIGLPAGDAVLQVEAFDKPRTLRSERKHFAIGSTLQKLSVEIPRNEITFSNTTKPERSERLVASLQFRGHTFEREFDAVPMAQNFSIANSAPEGLASIMIQDNRLKRRARTLVLDCSASMVDPHPLESVPRGSEDDVLQTSKLSGARLAVKDMLGRWQGSSDLVGVILFGHRVATGTPNQGTILQDRYFAKYPFSQSTQAYEDVETVLPVGRFSVNEYSDILNRLELLLPWGQTPLYLALQQAMSETPGLGSNVSHDIIVISDGKNYQFNPSPEKNVPIELVLQQAKDLGVRIHIIGFGIPTAELPEAIQQYRRLAEETGGTASFQIANSMDLVKRMETITAPESFVIQLSQNETWYGQCDEILSIPAPLEPNTPMWVNYRDQRRLIPVSPRSAIRMGIGSNERLVSDTFHNAGEPQQFPILKPNQEPSLFQLGIHPPRIEAGSVQWNLSLTRSDGDVPQRPNFIWVEIEPKDVASGDSAKVDEPYCITGDSWLADTPVPVLRFETKGWPENARNAIVRFSCTDTPPRVIGSIGIDRDWLAGHASQKTLNGKMAGTSIEYELEASGEEVSLTMTYSADNNSDREITPRLIGFRGPYRTERQYLSKQRKSIHRFIPETRPGDARDFNVGQEPSIEFLDMRDVQRVGLSCRTVVDLTIRTDVVTSPSIPPPKLKR